MTHAVSFFDKQFQRQIGKHDFTLNPFEQKALAFTKGRMLDFGWNDCFDTVAAIGLLMFLPCETARNFVPRLREATCDGSTAVINVLVQGTTYMEMFGNDPHCLFDPEEVHAWFDGWTIADFTFDDFAAPGGTMKRFATVIAQKAH